MLKNNLSLVVVSLCLLLTLNIYALDSSNRIIVQGFQNAKIGYELDLGKFHLKTLYTGDVLSENYFDLVIEGHIGMKWYCNDNTIEIIGAPGIEYKKGFKVKDTDRNSEVSTIVPSLNLSMYKHFKGFIIGGCFSLDTWIFQQTGSDVGSSGWYGIRKITVNPELIIGYDFNFKK